MSRIIDFFEALNVSYVEAEGYGGTVQFDKELVSPASGTITPDLTKASSSIKHYDLNGALTLSLPTLTAGKSGSAIFYVVQTGGGGHAVTWAAGYHINSGAIDTNALAVSVCYLSWVGDGKVDVTIVPRV